MVTCLVRLVCGESDDVGPLSEASFSAPQLLAHGSGTHHQDPNGLVALSKERGTKIEDSTVYDDRPQM